MSKAELDKFYAEDYRKIYGGGNSEAEKRHAETAMRMLKENIVVEVDDRLLDIGCSTGELVRSVNFTRINAYGIEPNTEHYEIAKSKGLNVENCPIENYDPGMKFDVITMLNALEHVLSPTDVLNKIHSLLNDDGFLLISVPNLHNKTIRIPIDAFLSSAHLFNLSINTITQYFLKCGFKIARAYGIVEEMGDKIYLLGQKTDQKQEYVPKIGPEVVKKTIEYLDKADKVWAMKYLMSQEGFK
jgi:2-polyprenyl-3-methyl-5-hydroxy-6-metoxy-1,4-benzoquinol methylase